MAIAMYMHASYCISLAHATIWQSANKSGDIGIPYQFLPLKTEGEVVVDHAL